MRENLNIPVESMAKSILMFPELTNAVRKAIESVNDFCYQYSNERYQKLGYPLGKSRQGFKKWQSRQLGL
jgi:hypothetical protein